MQTQQVGTRLVSDFAASVSGIGDLFVILFLLAVAALVLSQILKRRGLIRAGKFRGWA